MRQPGRPKRRGGRTTSTASGAADQQATGAAMRNENIVEFPSGRLLVRPSAGRTTVAALVKRLASRGRLRPPEPKHRPLSIGLADLTGISDGTLDLLTALAARRILTPASAARLAMRHASELGDPRFRRASCRREATYSHHIVLAGDLFGRSAFRVEERASGAWVACATFAAFDLLSDVCPVDGLPFCILPGLDGETTPSIVLRRPREWRSELAALAEDIDRSAERHLLVVGGLPDSGGRRAAIFSGVEDGLRRAGLRVRSSRRSARVAIETTEERARQARPYLVLIEIAFPGLVRVPGSGR